jgi:hypothetical protein
MDQIIIDEANNSFILWQGCQIHKKRGNRFGINPLNLLSLKVKRIVLNRNNQIKKLFYSLFYFTLTTNAKNSIEWDVPTNYN